METPDFCFYFLIRYKLCKTVNEILTDLVCTFFDTYPGLSTIERWIKDFDSRSFALETRTRLGRPWKTREEENDRKTMIEYLKTTGKRFNNLKQHRIPLKVCLLMWDRTYSHIAAETRDLLWNDEIGGHEEVTTAMQRAMERVSEDELVDQLKKLREHFHDVITAGGHYSF
uniref:Uncharacterized protein n=1 Tax=Lepeophtheirus salmonis TaxID=72036 RepID=A0A0K2TIJ8_LEPSM